MSLKFALTEYDVEIYIFETSPAKATRILQTSQTTSKQTSQLLRLFKTTLFVISGGLPKSPASCGKAPEGSVYLKQQCL